MFWSVGQSNSHIFDRIIELDHQLMQTQETLRRDEAKMELLRTTFEKCQPDLFCIRYRKLKAVILEVTRDVTIDSAMQANTQESAGEEKTAIVNTPDVGESLPIWTGLKYAYCTEQIKNL